MADQCVSQLLDLILDADVEETVYYGVAAVEENKKLKGIKDVADVRINNRTGSMTISACCVWGSFANVRPCAGCRGSYYCGRECQAIDWKRHKKACRAAQSSEYCKPVFNAKKWLNTMPGMPRLLRQTAFETADDLVPLAQVVIGNNSRGCAFIPGRMTSESAVEDLKSRLDSVGAEMIRKDPAPLANGLLRIVVVIYYYGGIQVLRLCV